MGNPMIPPARPVTGDEEIEAVVRVMRSGILTDGRDVKAAGGRGAEPATMVTAVNAL